MRADLIELLMVLLQVGHAAIRPSIWTIHAPEGQLGGTRVHDTRPYRVTTWRWCPRRDDYPSSDQQQALLEVGWVYGQTLKNPVESNGHGTQGELAPQAVRYNTGLASGAPW